MQRSSLITLVAIVFFLSPMSHVVGQGFGSKSEDPEKSLPAKKAEARLWEDATGKFKIRAILIEQTADFVRLQTEDDLEIKVPLKRLCKKDQEYLKALLISPDNPFAGGTPIPGKATTGENPARGSLPGVFRGGRESKSAGDKISLPDQGKLIDLKSSPNDEPFIPDPHQKPPAIPAGHVSVTPIDAYDKVSAPVLTNGDGAEFLVSIGRNMAGKPEETRGRIYTVNMLKKDSKLVWDFPSAVKLYDHDWASGRTLVVDKINQLNRGGELVMLEGLANGKAKTLYRRTLPGAGKPGFQPTVEWAKLLSGTHVAAIVNGTFYLWDLPAAKLIYRIERVSHLEPPVFSGSQRYMAIPQSGKVVIIETATGVIRKSIDTGNTLKPGVAFHPQGRLIAICFSNQYLVWDCVGDRIVSEATTVEHLASHPVSWLSPKMFRTAMGDTIHMDLGMSIWKYYVPLTSKPYVLGNKMLVTSTNTKCSLSSIEIPHSPAEKTIRQLMKAGDAAMLVRPGSSVAIAVEAEVAGVDQAEIKAALAEAAVKAGWKVSDRGPITLVAKIGRGKTQVLHFRSLGGGLQTSSTANLTPFTAELEIRRGSDVLWTRSTVNHIPFILHLKQGESVQAAVKSFEKPNPGFFSQMNLPPRIPKPEVIDQVGMSSFKDGEWTDIPAEIRRRSRNRSRFR